MAFSMCVCHLGHNGFWYVCMPFRSLRLDLSMYVCHLYHSNWLFDMLYAI